MKSFTLAILIALSGTVFAQSSNMKPGLWEIKQISHVVDGRDVTAQTAAARAKMQQAMANMSPAQREQMQAMMNRQGASVGGGGMRICISPAMAARDKPVLNSEGHCEPTKISRSGNKTRFEINCTNHGITTVGKGENTVVGDIVTNHMDLTTTDARGSHHTVSESQMKYLGSDCQGIKPADQLAK